MTRLYRDVWKYCPPVAQVGSLGGLFNTTSEERVSWGDLARLKILSKALKAGTGVVVSCTSERKGQQELVATCTIFISTLRIWHSQITLSRSSNEAYYIRRYLRNSTSDPTTYTTRTLNCENSRQGRLSSGQLQS